MSEQSFMSTGSERSTAYSSVNEQTTKIEEERLQRALSRLIARRTSNSTQQLDDEAKKQLPLGSSLPYGIGHEPSSHVIVLPRMANDSTPRWLIEMHGFNGRGNPIGIEIAGDVVLGVSRPNQEPPDFDLGLYRGDEKGVSRRHCVIRPSRNRLYIIDLQSTNGTRVNALNVGSGVAMELRNNDTVSVGALTFTVKILATPADFERARQADTRQAMD